MDQHRHSPIDDARRIGLSEHLLQFDCQHRLSFKLVDPAVVDPDAVAAGHLQMRGRKLLELLLKGPVQPLHQKTRQRQIIDLFQAVDVLKTWRQPLLQRVQQCAIAGIGPWSAKRAVQQTQSAQGLSILIAPAQSAAPSKCLKQRGDNGFSWQTLRGATFKNYRANGPYLIALQPSGVFIPGDALLPLSG